MTHGYWSTVCSRTKKQQTEKKVFHCFLVIHEPGHNSEVQPSINTSCLTLIGCVSPLVFPILKNVHNKVFCQLSVSVLTITAVSLSPHKIFPYFLLPLSLSLIFPGAFFPSLPSFMYSSVLFNFLCMKD